MPRFFVRKDQIENNLIRITGDDAHHISRALRMAAGEKIEVCDMQKRVYTCALREFLPSEVVAEIESVSETDTEPPYRIRLYQALPKSDKMETIIQKSVECGVCEIVPFSSERCIVKIDKRDEGKKLERWQKICESAAKQSGRGIIPKIEKILSFDQMINDSRESSLTLFCYEGEEATSIKEALKSRKIKGDVSIIIGSEGGFSQNEAEKIRASGALSVTLGKRILRCETAAPFALTCIAYESEL